MKSTHANGPRESACMRAIRNPAVVDLIDELKRGERGRGYLPPSVARRYAGLPRREILRRIVRG